MVADPISATAAANVARRTRRPLCVRSRTPGLAAEQARHFALEVFVGRLRLVGRRRGRLNSDDRRSGRPGGACCGGTARRQLVRGAKVRAAGPRRSRSRAAARLRLLRHGACAVGAKRAAERCFQPLRHIREVLIVREGRFDWPVGAACAPGDRRRLNRRLWRPSLTVHVVAMRVEILRKARERFVLRRCAVGAAAGKRRHRSDRRWHECGDTRLARLRKRRAAGTSARGRGRRRAGANAGHAVPALRLGPRLRHQDRFGAEIETRLRLDRRFAVRWRFDQMAKLRPAATADGRVAAGSMAGARTSGSGSRTG